MVFHALVYVFEGYYSVYKDNIFEVDGEKFITYSKEMMPYKVFAILLLVANFVMANVLIYFQYLSIKNMGKSYLYRFYSIVDVAYIIMCVVVMFMAMDQLATDQNDYTYDQFRNFTSS